jgi:hypothetical protein
MYSCFNPLNWTETNGSVEICTFVCFFESRQLSYHVTTLLYRTLSCSLSSSPKVFSSLIQSSWDVLPPVQVHCRTAELADSFPVSWNLVETRPTSTQWISPQRVHALRRQTQISCKGGRDGQYWKERSSYSCYYPVGLSVEATVSSCTELSPTTITSTITFVIMAPHLAAQATQVCSCKSTVHAEEQCPGIMRGIGIIHTEKDTRSSSYKWMFSNKICYSCVGVKFYQ